MLHNYQRALVLGTRLKKFFLRRGERVLECHIYEQESQVYGIPGEMLSPVPFHRTVID